MVRTTFGVLRKCVVQFVSDSRVSGQVISWRPDKQTLIPAKLFALRLSFRVLRFHAALSLLFRPTTAINLRKPPYYSRNTL